MKMKPAYINDEADELEGEWEEDQRAAEQESAEREKVRIRRRGMTLNLADYKSERDGAVTWDAIKHQYGEHVIRTTYACGRVSVEGTNPADPVGAFPESLGMMEEVVSDAGCGFAHCTVCNGRAPEEA